MLCADYPTGGRGCLLGVAEGLVRGGGFGLGAWPMSSLVVEEEPRQVGSARVRVKEGEARPAHPGSRTAWSAR